MKAHIVALSAVAVASMAGNGYLYQQLDQLNTSYESLNSSYATANAEFAEQAKLGETLAKEAESLKAEIAKKEALAAEAAKASEIKPVEEVADEVADEVEETIIVTETFEIMGQKIEVSWEEKKKPPADNSNNEQVIKTFMERSGLPREKAQLVIKVIQENKNNTNHYEGPLYNTAWDKYPTEYQELIIEFYCGVEKKSREEFIESIQPYDPWEGITKGEFICEGVSHAKPTGRPYPGLG